MHTAGDEIGADVGRSEEHEALIDGALQLLRSHLGLDVTFVSRLTDTERVLRNVTTAEIDLRDDAHPTLAAGDAEVRAGSYCHHIVAGTLPAFLLDPSRHPVAAALPVTDHQPVGTHLGVPLVLSDGTVYGAFCGFSHQVLPHLGERDLALVRRLAALVASQVEQAEFAHGRDRQHRQRLTALVPGRDLLMARQPIVTLADRSVLGFEMLARFPTLGSGPDRVFAEAWQVGVGVELELAACQRAFAARPAVDRRQYLAVNVSPATLVDPRFLEAASCCGPSGLVVEITEHARVDDYPALLRAVRALCAQGARLAIDDVGTGFSGLDHILRLEPHLLKIDGALVRDLDTRRGARAMVSALVGYVAEVGATLVAEQIESEAELTVLQELGVTCGQGYLLARPELERADAPPAGVATSV